MTDDLLEAVTELGWRFPDKLDHEVLEWAEEYSNQRIVHGSILAYNVVEAYEKGSREGEFGGHREFIRHLWVIRHNFMARRHIRATLWEIRQGEGKTERQSVGVQEDFRSTGYCEDYPCCGHEAGDCFGQKYGSDQSIKEAAYERMRMEDEGYFYYEED